MSIQVATKEMFLTDLVDRYSKLAKANAKTGVFDLQKVRDVAAAWLQDASFPTVRDEEWRFTDLSPLLQVRLNLPEIDESKIQLADFILPVKSPEELPYRLVFVNGILAPHLSTVRSPNLPSLPIELYAGNLSDVPEAYRARINDILSQQKPQNDVFAALNLAGLTDAAVVFVPANLPVEMPIHLLFLTVSGASATIAQPHCIIVADRGSKVTLIEDYATVGKVPAFTNAVTEVFVGENAEVNHVRLQRESWDVFHVGTSSIEQARNSRYSCHAISMGGKISRHNLDVVQRGEGTETTLNGLTSAFGEQLADTHSSIGFNHPHGTSRQLHKCIIGNKARAVFNGKVFVPKAAQLTDAGQLSRNLLLSPRARIDTKPQLEIVADNVKCSHGATVSQLEDDELFYLQSRGLDLETSRYLLIDAFAAEILDKLPVLAVAKMLSTCVAVPESLV